MSDGTPNTCPTHTPKLNLDCGRCMEWAHATFTFAEWQANSNALIADPGGLSMWRYQGQQNAAAMANAYGTDRTVSPRWWDEGAKPIRRSFWQKLRSAWWAAVEDWKGV